MNLRRGLMRSWIAGSATWIIAALLFGYRHCRVIDTLEPSPSYTWCDGTFGVESWPELIWLWMIGVPLFGLALGFAVSWVISGFSHEPR
jgi:hypothetical protein